MNTVPFKPEKICDLCGSEGAYDFMGDYICDTCYDKHNPECPDCGAPNCEINH